MRQRLAAVGLEALSRWHGSVRVICFGVRRVVPVRGTLATSLVQRHNRNPTWKSAIFRAFPVGDGECLVDVGSSIGQTLLEYRAVRPRGSYVGLDPNPRSIAYLDELIEANGFEDCRLFCFAASDQPGPAVLHLATGNDDNSGGTLIESLRPTQNDDALGVAMLPLDTALPFIEPRKVRLVKIDVEGAELFTIRGMSQLIARHRPAIACEVLFADPAADPAPVEQRNAELAGLLHTLGYRIYQIVKVSEADTEPRVRRIEAFPTGIYTRQTSHLCDYMFVPDEQAMPLPQAAR
jgi:FkbM family methyltransferase